MFQISNFCILDEWPSDDTHDETLPDLTTLAENITCYLCGYIIRQEIRRTSCDKCRKALTGPKPTGLLDVEDHRLLTMMKDNGGPNSGLTMPSHGVFVIGRS